MNAAGVATGGRVLVTGGGGRSPAYRQILADLTGRPVLAADPTDANEASARGATLQAAAVTSGLPVEQVRQAWAVTTTVVAEPRPGTENLRTELLARYLAVANWTGFDSTDQGAAT